MMQEKKNSAGKMQPYDEKGRYASKSTPNVISNKKNVLENKVFYHGSPNQNIKQFDESKAGENVYVDEAGIFFTDNKDFAEDFSYEQLEGSSFLTRKRGRKGSVYEVELEMTNPLDLNNLTEEQTQDLLENYLKDVGLSAEAEKRAFKDYMDAKNIQGAKDYIDFKKLSASGKYDGYIADLGGKYKGSNEYVIFKGNQAKIKKEYNDGTQANLIEEDYKNKYDDLPW